MPISNQSALANANTMFSAFAEEIFGEGRAMPGVYSEYTEIRQTDTKLVEHDVVEAFPVVRQWLGEKQFPDVVAATQSITVLTYEQSFAIKRLDLLSDRTGVVGRGLRRFLDESAYIYDNLAHAALIANGTGYDGVSLFSASHPRGPAGATQSNTSTTALSHVQFEAVMIAGASLRDANSEPLRINYNLLRVGPKLAALAREITGSNERVIAVDNSGAESGTRVAAATGPNARGLQVFDGGAVRVVVDPRLVGTYDDYYYFFDTTRGPALIGYEMRAPEAIAMDRMDDEGRFTADEFRYSVECDIVFAPGLWQTAYRGVV